MAKHVFKTDLSVNGIEQLKNDLINYKNVELQQKLNLLVKRLAEKGVMIAKANAAKLDAIFTGELLGSISAKSGSANGTAIFYIVADSKHAVFVEFGTGQMGQEAPYPYPLPIDWEYGSGKTIFEISPGQYGWFYPKGNKWYFTQGMPSRPFMYETALELQELILQTAREVFA